MTTRRLILPLLVLAVAAPVALSGCSPAENPWPQGDKRLHVVVSFPPLDSFVKKVAGDHAVVRCLAKESGVHHYEPTRNDAALLRGADFLFANGLELDDAYLEKVRINSGNANLVYVRLGEEIPKDQLIKMENGEVDPHVWLGLTQAVEMVDAVRRKLDEADKEHAAYYDANAGSYTKELKDLLEEGKNDFHDKKNKNLISFHESLNYFARDFDLHVVGYIEPGPGLEPSSARFKDMVALCEKHHVRVIAAEPQYPETAVNVIKDGLKKDNAGEVEFVTIDPMETATDADLQSADWYVKTMKENIQTLAKTLQ